MLEYFPKLVLPEGPHDKYASRERSHSTSSPIRAYGCNFTGASISSNPSPVLHFK